jgi:hypothetical protein
MCEYGTLKPAEGVLRRGMECGGRRMELNQGIIYVYIKMSH